MFLENVYNFWSFKELFDCTDFKKHIKKRLLLYFHQCKTLTEICTRRFWTEPIWENLIAHKPFLKSCSLLSGYFFLMCCLGGMSNSCLCWSLWTKQGRLAGGRGFVPLQGPLPVATRSCITPPWENEAEKLHLYQVQQWCSHLHFFTHRK